MAQESTPNGSLEITMPTVLCTDSDSELSKTFLSSDKISLSSDLGTPASPLKLSSPVSLPSSPSPFTKGPPATPQLSVSQNKETAVNSGSATGNPRNKCALQPGHSLMDWIRLGNSGKDLTGVGGRIRPVTPSELANHNTNKDAWLAIRGRVYNITHYLPYHPGGAEELMRGAGMDATQLFDKVHPWVNYDSLLAKCLVGPLTMDRPDAEELFGSINPSPKSDRLKEPSKTTELVRKSMENLANCITPVRKKMTKSEENVKGSPPSKIMQSLIQSSDLPVSISRRAGSSPVRTNDKQADITPSPLRFDWIQTSTKLTLSVYTGPLANPGVCARLNDGVLLIEVATNKWLRTLKLIPEDKLKEPLQLKIFAESGKIEVIVEKLDAGIWKNCGEMTASVATQVSSPRTVECRVSSVSRLSHDTVLLYLTPGPGPAIIPFGYHIRVHLKDKSSENVRSYTPIGDGWGQLPDCTGSLKLAVKKYKTGIISAHLTSLNVGDAVTLSGPYGNFQLQKLKNVTTIWFIAAGTGITPMLGLIKLMLARSNVKCDRVHLIFFNKTEADILFRETFNDIAKHDKRFTATYVLSDADSSWSGPKGRINKELLLTCTGKNLLKCTDRCTHFACICGPTEFTQTGMELLRKLGLKDECIHGFMG